MSNALDYIDWRGDLTFSADPFNIIDIFLFSQLATPDYSGIVSSDGAEISLAEASKLYFETHSDDVSNLGVLQSDSVLPMLKVMADSPRFMSLKLSSFYNKVDQPNEEQCCAVTIKLSDNEVFVSFRGTDDTIIGWKEDFNISTMDAVPAQLDALNYLDRIAQLYSGDIYICGHSKGGNLAIYSAAMCSDDIKDRIRGVYNFDGPGFQEDFIASPEFKSIESKVTTVLSQYSIIGALLCRAGKVMVVKSNVAGPMAHDGFKWEVLGKEFVETEEVSEITRAFNQAMDETIDSMETEEKQAFIEELFDTLFSTGAVTITDFKSLGRQQIIGLLKAFKDDEKVSSFAASVGGNIFKILKEKQTQAFSEKLEAGKNILLNKVMKSDTDSDETTDNAEEKNEKE